MQAGADEYLAKRLILATGVVDELPAIAGLGERWGKTVFHCPYCHGYELGRKRLGVLATSPLSLHTAALVSDWAAPGQTTLFLNAAFEPDAEQLAELKAREIHLERELVSAAEGEAPALDVRLRDGRVSRLDGLFVLPRTLINNPIAEQLGCELEQGPTGAYYKTDMMKETTVPGVFACGRGAPNGSPVIRGGRRHASRFVRAPVAHFSALAGARHRFWCDGPERLRQIECRRQEVARHMNRSGALKGSFILFSLSCTPFEPGSDRLPDAATPEPEWLCLRAPPQAPPPPAAPERVTYVLSIVDYDSRERAPAAVAGLQVTVCSSARCEPPVPTCAGVLTPDCVDVRQMAAAPPFRHTLSFPYGFEDAVLRLQAPGYVEVDYALGGPMVGSPDGAPIVTGLAVALPLWTTAERISLEMGSSPSPEHHTLLLRALDCDGQRAPGVTLRTSDDEQGIAFTLSDDAPIRREMLVTGARGVAGLIGLPSPTIDVIGVSPSGVEFGGPTRIHLRPGVITVAEVRHGLGVWGQ